MRRLLLYLSIPYLIGFLGAGLNQIVILANHGKFPVLGLDNTFPTDNIHIVMTHATHLNWLADWIRLGDVIASPGDCFIWTAIPLLQVTCYAYLILCLYFVLNKRNQNGTVSSLPRPVK